MIIHNTPYYNKYTSIIIAIGDSTESNIKRVLSLAKKYDIYYGISFMNDLILTKYQSPYIRIKFDRKILTYGDISRLEETNKSFRWTNGKVFNLNELHLVEMLLKTGDISPTYKPRRKRNEI